MDEISTFIPHGRGLLHVVSVPLLLEGELPAVLGRLTAGFFLDDDLAAQFKGLTGSEIAFGAGGRIVASTLPAEPARGRRSGHDRPRHHAGHRSAARSSSPSRGRSSTAMTASLRSRARPSR